MLCFVALFWQHLHVSLLRGPVYDAIDSLASHKRHPQVSVIDVECKVALAS